MDSILDGKFEINSFSQRRHFFFGINVRRFNNPLLKMYWGSNRSEFNINLIWQQLSTTKLRQWMTFRRQDNRANGSLKVGKWIFLKSILSIFEGLFTDLELELCPVNETSPIDESS